nr:MAG: hypothetical protein [Bacteriophage sp.]
MGKKRKCRYTPEENAIHKEAVRLRNMTDRQLVEAFHRAADTETTARTSTEPQAAPEEAEAKKNTSDVEKLLSALSEGKVKGIKSGIAYKVAQLAEEMGLI